MFKTSISIIINFYIVSKNYNLDFVSNYYDEVINPTDGISPIKNSCTKCLIEMQVNVLIIITTPLLPSGLILAVWDRVTSCLFKLIIVMINSSSFIVIIKQKMPSFIDFEFCSSFLSINYSIVWFPRFGHLGTIQNTAGEEEPIGEKAPSLRNRIISFQQRNRPQPRADNFPTSRS